MTNVSIAQLSMEVNVVIARLLYQLPKYTLKLYNLIIFHKDTCEPQYINSRPHFSTSRASQVTSTFDKKLKPAVVSVGKSQTVTVPYFHTICLIFPIQHTSGSC